MVGAVELQRHQTQGHEHLQENQQDFRRHLSEVQQEVQVQVQVQPVVSGEEVEFQDIHCVSQSLAEGSQSQILCTTNRSGAPESSSEILQLRREHDHLSVRSRNWDTEALRCQSAVSPLQAKVAPILRLREKLLKSKDKHCILHTQTFFV